MGGRCEVVEDQSHVSCVIAGDSVAPQKTGVNRPREGFADAALGEVAAKVRPRYSPIFAVAD